MKIMGTQISGVKIIETDVYKDERGHFLESYHNNRYSSQGIQDNFVQDNLSYSKKNVLRGLHLQYRYPQAKLITVITGEIFDVAVDVRPESSTFRQWVGVTLSENNQRQFFIPEGLAHGFCVLSDFAYVHYKCSQIYKPDDEFGIIWDDPDLNIEWPLDFPVVSAKDQQNLTLQGYVNSIKEA